VEGIAMTAKFRMQVRGVQIEWEGEAAFLKDQLPSIVAKIVEAVSQLPEETTTENDASPPAPKNVVGKFTTANMASKTKPDTGSKLFLTALAKLQLSDRIDPASRNQIHDEMKTVSSVYKSNMQGNLTKIIKQLMDNGSINEPATGQFALSPTKLAEMKAKVS
jgi:hypothetical protein